MLLKLLRFIASFTANRRIRKIDVEIYERIFPHLQRENDHGYAFGSNEELRESNDRDHDQTFEALGALERKIAGLPKGYGLAFRHIVYRDLNARLDFYQNLARRRTNPKSIDPRFVATHA